MTRAQKDAYKAQMQSLQDASKLYSSDSTAAYRALAGEAEARATQARMNMNAAQRREVFPLDSYDVPVDQLIVRRTSDGPQMSTGLLGKSTYPQAQALETARKNAVKMLGLPENNTPMDRARAMGFDVDAYHGTNRDFSAFSNEMLGAKTGAKSAQKAHFSASNPEVANTYVSTSHVNPFSWESPPVPPSLLKNPQAWQEFNEAATNEAKWAVLEKYGKNRSHGQVMPLMIRSGDVKVKDYGGVGYRDEAYNDVIKAAKKAKKDTVILKNTFDPGPHEGYRTQSDIYAVMDPSRIRSRFAVFDPARINENDLLGRADPYLLGILGLGAGGAAYMMQDPKASR